MAILTVSLKRPLTITLTSPNAGNNFMGQVDTIEFTDGVEADGFVTGVPTLAWRAGKERVAEFKPASLHMKIPLANVDAIVRR